MARVVAFVPDLLFGSNVRGALVAAGHDVVLAGDAMSIAAALPGADVLVVDLTDDAATRIELVATLATRPPALAFFSHVEPEVRDRALAAGLELVVPRSRMNREGPALVAGLVDGDPAD